MFGIGCTLLVLVESGQTRGTAEESGEPPRRRVALAAEGSTPERLLKINREDLALWRRLVKEAGIPLE